ncbi:MAG: hypothetical protein DBY45_05840 [Clostridiales bacterium]|nr:MAG: hypothetical protein DBY45_05840 [Clostridiales bacterium]
MSGLSLQFYKKGEKTGRCYSIAARNSSRGTSTKYIDVIGGYNPPESGLRFVRLVGPEVSVYRVSVHGFWTRGRRFHLPLPHRHQQAKFLSQ